MLTGAYGRLDVVGVIAACIAMVGGPGVPPLLSGAKWLEWAPNGVKVSESWTVDRHPLPWPDDVPLLISVAKPTSVTNPVKLDRTAFLDHLSEMAFITG